jgi:hypothetical protein
MLGILLQTQSTSLAEFYQLISHGEIRVILIPPLSNNFFLSFVLFILHVRWRRAGAGNAVVMKVSRYSSRIPAKVFMASYARMS